MNQWMRKGAAGMVSGQARYSDVKRRRSLRSVFAWNMLPLVLIPTIVLLSFMYWQIDRSLQAQQSSALDIAGKLELTKLKQWFDERESQLALLATQASTIDAIRELQERHLGIVDKQEDPWEAVSYKVSALFEDELEEQLLHNVFLEDFYVLNPQGRFLFAMKDTRRIGQSVLTDGASRHVFKPLLDLSLTAPGAHLHVDPREALEEPFALMSFPLNEQDGSPLGLLIQRIRLGAMMAELQGERRPDYRSYLLQLDAKGIIMMDPREEGPRFPKGQEVRAFQKLVSEAGPALKEHEGQPNTSSEPTRMIGERSARTPGISSAVSYRSSDGQPRLAKAYLLDVMGTNWALLATLDQSNKFSLLSTLLWGGLLCLLLVAVLFVFAMRRFTRHLVEPLKDLGELSVRVAQGEKGLLAKAGFSHELDDLARSFNQMLAAITQQEESLLARISGGEQALQSLTELKFALDQHSIVAVTDVAGTITYVNEKFEEISGYDSDELLGQNHRMLNSGTHSEAFWREMFLQISKGKTWRAQICNRAKDGTLYWVDTTVVAFMRQGKAKNYIAIRTDITQTKQAEQELIEAKESAEAGARAKSEFLASMSHEIRTPMNGVLGMLNLIKRTPLSDEQRRQADLAYGSAESLLTIINDILDFSKIEAGKLDLEEMDFDLIAELCEFADTIAPRIEEKGLEFVLDLSGVEQTWVRGDPGRLRQILINLVGNALKFTEQGEIVLKARLLQSHRGYMKLEISVSDTGIGIPPEKRNILFESFSQVDASTTRKFGGTGLGLTIVKQLCELMGGSVQVESEPGKGSEFCFSILLSASEFDKAHSITALPSHLRILVADANAARRVAVHQLCESWQVNVVEAENQSAMYEALVVSDEQHQIIDVLVVDAGLPNGLNPDVSAEQHREDLSALLSKIREDARFNGLKMLILLPANMPSKGKDSWQSYADVCLHKPLKPRALHQTLMQLSKVTTRSDSRPVPRAEQDPTDKNGDLKQIAAGVRILLVEDNPVNQLVASALLGQFGLVCDLAGNGLEALAALENSPSDMPYHLVLMDCQMPEMDGYEASRGIRAGDAGGRNRDVLIIAMTANAMKGDREKCLDAGMNDYISKPIEAEVLQQTLERWLLHEPVAYLEKLRKEMRRRPVIEEAESAAIQDQESTATESEAAGQVVWDKDTAVQNLGGNEELYAQLSEAALEDIPSNIDRLKVALAEQDYEAAKIAAHSIKGVASSIGGMQLMAVAQKTELAARAKQMADLEQSYPLLQSSFETLYKLMHAQ